MLDELDIHILTSTKDLVTKNLQNNTPNNITLIGNPDFNQESDKLSFSDNFPLRSIRDKNDSTKIALLPYTQIEIEKLDSVFTASNKKIDAIFTGKNATESALKNLNSPQILHIATHGFFLENLEKDTKDSKMIGFDKNKVFNNPLLRSGLLFTNAKKAFLEDNGSDGILTAYEAMNLNLDNTDLVVLSACKTGLGDLKNGEGVYGLQRAFQTAGAKTVLMSLWVVNDEVTMKLMSAFYKNWILGKQTKREAFKNAQIEIQKMDKGKYKSPYYWGGFVMVGE